MPSGYLVGVIDILLMSDSVLNVGGNKQASVRFYIEDVTEMQHRVLLGECWIAAVLPILPVPVITW